MNDVKTMTRDELVKELRQLDALPVKFFKMSDAELRKKLTEALNKVKVSLF